MNKHSLLSRPVFMLPEKSFLTKEALHRAAHCTLADVIKIVRTEDQFALSQEIRAELVAWLRLFGLTQKTRIPKKLHAEPLLVDVKIEDLEEQIISELSVDGDRDNLSPDFVLRGVLSDGADVTISIYKSSLLCAAESIKKRLPVRLSTLAIALLYPGRAVRCDAIPSLVQAVILSLSSMYEEDMNVDSSDMNIEYVNRVTYFPDLKVFRFVFEW